MNQTVASVLAVAVGSGIGGTLRYGVMRLFAYCLAAPQTPCSINGLLLGALPVNVIGCFIAGLFWGILTIMPVSPSVYLFLLVGLCGGFTTFSSYMLETMLLGRHALPWALLNIIVSTSGGFVALYLGVLCSRFWVG